MMDVAMFGAAWKPVEVRIGDITFVAHIREVPATDRGMTEDIKVTMPMHNGGLARPAGLSWEEELQSIADFNFKWPANYGTESFTAGVEGRINLHGTSLTARVAQTIRDNRDRLVIWLNNYPTAEFVATTDGKHFASLLKPQGRKVLKAGELLPLLYEGAQLANYREITGMSGSGVPSAPAVVIERSDLASAVHHAAARWLGRRGYPVTKAE